MVEYAMLIYKPLPMHKSSQSEQHVIRTIVGREGVAVGNSLGSGRTILGIEDRCASRAGGTDLKTP